MPLPSDRLPATLRTGPAKVANLERQLRELRAARRLEHAAVGAIILPDAISTTTVGVISVLDHGAVGDGSADDSTAIQEAIDAVGPSGGIVVFPPGTYLLGGATGLTLTTPGTVLRGSGPENTKILIGSAFTDTAAVRVLAYNCQVQDLSVSGASSTTVSNPPSNAIEITGVRRAKVSRVTFFNVNGWAVQVSSTPASGTSNPIGTHLSSLYGSACAGGVHFLGDTTQGYAMNSLLSDVQFQSGGVTSGPNANLDQLRIEDAWDVLGTNVLMWTSLGTGSSLHIVGNCAASFITNLDALGPSGGPCVLIEDGPNGSPQNVQLSGGVIQQGTPGVRISGGSRQIHINTTRLINNQTHGVEVSGTSTTIYLSELFFSGSGNGASGTCYDINWSGSAVGWITNCRFATPIVTVGTAGVQGTINVAAAGQNVRVINASFQGTSSTSSNWFTNTPAAVFDASSGPLNFMTRPGFKAGVALQPALGGTALSVNVNGTQTFDALRVLDDGSFAAGTGSAARDTTWGRQGVAQFGTPNSDIVIGLAGKGLRVKEGTNAKLGTATLVAGSAVVSNTSVTATSRIQLTAQSLGTVTAPKALAVTARTAGTSFTITSADATDTSVVAWEITEPA